MMISHSDTQCFKYVALGTSGGRRLLGTRVEISTTSFTSSHKCVWPNGLSTGFLTQRSWVRIPPEVVCYYKYIIIILIILNPEIVGSNPTGGGLSL